MSKPPSAGDKSELRTDTEQRERAAALARLIAYFLAYCLDASLAAAQETLSERPAQGDDVVAPTHAGSDAFGFSQLH